MTTTEIINICIAATTALTAIISVIIATLTLRQNKKMLEDESRPYVTVYGAITKISAPRFYIIVKNFGKSAAIIDEFTFSPQLQQYGNLGAPFQNFSGTMIAPGQSFKAVIEGRNYSELPTVKFNIHYHWRKKHYEKTVSLKIEAYNENVVYRIPAKNGDLHIISDALQEIVDQNL